MSESSGTIVVIEDEAQIRKFLRISLEAQGYVVHEARLAADGLRLCAATQPNLLILDLGLPDMDGQQFIHAVRAWSQVPIVVLSVRGSETDKVQALDAGANDYVTKPFGIGELMARIRAVLRDNEEGDGEDGEGASPRFEADGLAVDFSQRTVRVDGREIRLSRKEFELIRLLMLSRGKVLTHQQILRQVWSDAQRDETHYLRVLVGQLRHKLGDEPTRPRFIVTVQGVGYRLAVSPP
ncbi:MAG: DNA-binding response regulator [Lysobacterales bacterium]|nr:MAG: DNA-binding response regulator [Xanthomonadales bacterium]